MSYGRPRGELFRGGGTLHGGAGRVRERLGGGGEAALKAPPARPAPGCYCEGETMSKLSFRARALDAAKPLPIYRGKDMPDLNDCVSINRAVPQMPTGMEKEEESVREPRRGGTIVYQTPPSPHGK